MPQLPHAVSTLELVSPHARLTSNALYFSNYLSFVQQQPKGREGFNLSACTGSIFSKINTYLEVSQQVNCFHFACIEVSSNLIHLHVQPSQIDSTLQDA